MATKLESTLARRDADIIDKWFDLVVSTYPPDTARFIKSKKDPFANPVGQTTRKGLATVFRQLCGDMDHESIVAALDPIIRIRAVQDFTPSGAVAFIPDLKQIIRALLKSETTTFETLSDLVAFERRIDRLTLIGFDIYMVCREQVAQLRVSTEREKIYKAFARAGLIVDDPAPGPDRSGS